MTAHLAAHSFGAGASLAPRAVGVARSQPKSASAARLNAPGIGILLILASTAFFSCSDIATKHLAGSLPAIEIAWLRYIGFCVLMVPAAIAKGPGRLLRTHRPGLQILRGLAMVLSAVLFTFSLRFLPVAEATATNFVSPLFITALSIPLLGEKVGWRRWTAALVGLLGVLIVVRPGTSAFHPAALLPILAALSWAGAAILTRKLSGGDKPATTLAYSALTGLAVLTLLVPFDWVLPDWRELAVGALIGLVATAGHWMIVLAYRQADASVLAPFSYMQLIGSGVLAFLIFGAIPDSWTFVGAGVIIASGLYTAHRERVRSRLARSRAPGKLSGA